MKGSILMVAVLATSAAAAPVPNDGLDDRAAIQAMLDAPQCDVRLPSGVFDVDAIYPRGTGVSQLDMLKVRSGCSLRGSGPGTLLRFRGDASYTGWHGIGMVGPRVLVGEMTIDTTAIYDTTEQTHAIGVYGGVPDDSVWPMYQTIQNVWFVHPPRGAMAPGPGIPMAGGDCIKVISYQDTRPSSVHVVNNHFLRCDRSGISTVGGYRSLIVANNTFYDTGDQDFDVEGNNLGINLIYTGNVHLLGAVTQGAFATSLASTRLDYLLMTGNVLNGRGALISSVTRGVIANNTILCRKGIDPCIRALKRNDDLAIVGNVVVLAATTPDGSAAYPRQVIALAGQSGGNPGDIILEGNILRNETTNATVLTSSARRLRMVGNTLEWRPTVPPTSATGTLMAVGSLPQRVYSVTVVGNDFVGLVRHAVEIDVILGHMGIGKVTMVGNTSDGPLAGYWCRAPALLPTSVLSVNHWPAPATNTCTMAGSF